MAYQVLARKWRPATFEALVGQEHVLRALKHALDGERLHHAYLFTGTRGVGKTTIARILAKGLNCDRGISAVPCDECASCTEIREGRSVDLIEVDAASRTKVEDTRELLDNVQYAPTRSRFKVYLIDEVHMLSGHSFNALLKTLEEPPEHVKFLLATTDPQKLPATVLSRCLQFNLKNLSAQRIGEHLRHVLTEEGVDFDDGALWQIGRAAAGSMRDALSLTDQAIAFGGGTLREADVAGMLGTVDRSHVFELLERVAADDVPGALACCETMAEQGVDFGLAVDGLSSVLHRVALAQVVPAAVDREEGDAERVIDLAGGLAAEDVQLFYELAQAARGRFSEATDPRQAFEMLVLRLVAFRPVAALDPSLGPDDVEAVPPARSAGEGDAGAKKPEPPPAAASGEAARDQDPAGQGPKATRTQPVSASRPGAATTPGAGPAAGGVRAAPPDTGAGAAEAADARDGGDPDEDWWRILGALGLSGSAHNIASHCVIVARETQRWTLRLDAQRANLFNERHAQVIAGALSRHLGRSVGVSIEPGPVDGETPARRATRLAAERLAEARARIAADPRVRSLLEDFDGELLDDSVTVDGHADGREHMEDDP